MTMGVGGQKCDWQHSIAHPPIDAKISQISHTQTEFCPKFRSMATGVDRKNAVCSIQWPILEPPSLWAQKSRRYLLHKPSYSQFCIKFRWHGNGGRSGKNAIGSIRWPIPETPL